MIQVPGNYCGSIVPQTFDIIQFQDMPSVQHTHVPYFHSMLCNWANNIALPFLWVVVITAQSKNTLVNKIKNMGKYEPQGWDTGSAVDATWTDATQDVIGCIFAQAVRIPGESMGIEHAGITEGSRRGFINAPIATGRGDFEPLELTFIETNQSFTDGVLRPWTIIANHEGLIATAPGNSIKSDIYIYQLAKAGNHTPNIIRKAWRFKDCVPVNISSDDLTYGSSSDHGKRQTQFVYNSYSMQSPAYNNNSTSKTVPVSKPVNAPFSSNSQNLISTTPQQTFTRPVQNLA